MKLTPVFALLFAAVLARPGFAVGAFSDTGQLFGATSVFGLAAGDIDSDGDLDLIVGQMGGLPTLVLTNDGTGAFTDTGQALGACDSRRVHLADADNDGDMDIYQAHTSGIIVWLNNGAGVFTNSGGTFVTDHTVVVFPADVDSDGDMDFGTAVTTPPGDVYLNNGDGTFTNSGGSLNTTAMHSVYLLDVDGDGDADSVSGAWGGTSQIWSNNGAGTFTNSGQSLGTAQTTSAMPYDYNGDGSPDVFIGNTSGQADTLWFNDGAGNFSNSAQALGTTSTYAVAAGDYDGDGDPDIYQSNIGAQADVVLLNDGAGNFTDLGEAIGNLSGYNAINADIDGDGDLDIIQGNIEAGGYVKIFRNNFDHANSAPAAPVLTAEPDVSIITSTTAVTLQWAAGSDADTADADFLTYDVRIGTTSGGCEIFCGTFPQAALARAAGPGNTGGALFVNKTLAPGLYYWSVRTVDATYNRSTWSAEDSFVVDNTSPTAGVVTPASSDGTNIAPSFNLSTPFTVNVSPVVSCEFCKATDGTCDTEWAAGTWGAGTCSAAGLTCTAGQTVTLNMRATDQLGRTGSGTVITRTCDATGPAAATVTPANTDTGVFVDRTFDLSTAFTDTSGVASCEYCKATDGTCDTEWAAGTWGAGTCSASNLTCTNGQTVTLNMRATDIYGSLGTAAAVSRYCSTPTPGAVVPANADSGTSVDETFDLSTTFADDAGITSCEYCAATDGACDTEWIAGTWSAGAGACSVTGLTCTHAQSLTLNMRATNFASDVGTAVAVNRACDANAPLITALDPAAGTVFNTTSPSINVTTDENADCKWSFTDQAYAAMAGDCTGDGTTQQICAPGAQAQGTMQIHIACRDTVGHEQTAATNTDAQYFILQGSYTTGTDKQFIYICPPVPAPTAAQLTQVQQLTGGVYVDVDVTQLTACAGLAAVTTGPVALNASVPDSVTHTLTAGWNLVYNPYGTALEYDGTHFNFRKSGAADPVSLDVCTDVADYAILGTGNGQATYVPDDSATIPAFTAFLVYSAADGELIINQ